jgi:hypothetical protein
MGMRDLGIKKAKSLKHFRLCKKISAIIYYFEILGISVL